MMKGGKKKKKKKKARRLLLPFPPFSSSSFSPPHGWNTLTVARYETTGRADAPTFLPPPFPFSPKSEA